MSGQTSIYLEANGWKYHVANPATMDACNFSWDEIVRKPKSEIDAILTGNPINKDSC